MTRQKRAALLLSFLFIGLLSGCAGGWTVRVSYRDLEQLRVVQTLGIDYEDGLTRVSVSTGAGAGEDSAPILKTAAASGIEEAMEELQRYSSGEDFLFSHTQFILLGEEAAREDLLHCLDFIERAPQMRADTPLFIIKNGKAASLITQTGGESYDISAVLAALLRDAGSRSLVPIGTCRDTVRTLSGSGSALLCALEAAEISLVSRSAQGEEGDLTALTAGCAVLRDGALAGYLSREEAEAACLLLGMGGHGPVPLDDGTVILTGSDCETRPLRRNGAVTGFSFSLRLRAAVAEAGRQGDPDPERLRAQLEETVFEWACGALSKSRGLRADFLDLVRTAERAFPGQKIPAYGAWPEGPAFFLSVTAEIERGYDLRRPLTLEGGGGRA